MGEGRGPAHPRPPDPTTRASARVGSAHRPGCEPGARDGAARGRVIDRASGSVDILAGRPRSDHAGTMEVVAVEQVGTRRDCAYRDAPGANRWRAASPGVDSGTPDGVQHRPDEAIDRPGITIWIVPVGGQNAAPEGRPDRRGRSWRPHRLHGPGHSHPDAGPTRGSATCASRPRERRATPGSSGRPVAGSTRRPPAPTSGGARSAE